MKKQIFTVVFCILSLLGKAQHPQPPLGLTFEDVIAHDGKDFMLKILENGDKVLIYDKEAEGIKGAYTQTRFYYFMNLEESTFFCFKIIWIDPITELEAWQDFFKKENIKKIGELLWRNDSSNTNYFIQLDVEDGKCVVMEKIVFDELK